MTRLFLMLPLAAAIGFSQTAPKVERDIAYAEPRNERHLLDVYTPAAEGTGRPVVVWVHGGGWQQGSKEIVGQKPAAFTERVSCSCR